MTDARIPERWLNDRRIRVLTSAEFRSYVFALVWAVSNRTDGRIEEADLAYIPAVDPNHVQRMLSERLWEIHPRGGWVISDFSATQTSREQLEGLERRKRGEASRSKSYRERRKAGSSRDGSRDESRDDIGQAGQAGQAPYGTELNEEEKDRMWNQGLQR